MSQMTTNKPVGIDPPNPGAESLPVSERSAIDGPQAPQPSTGSEDPPQHALYGGGLQLAGKPGEQPKAPDDGNGGIETPTSGEGNEGAENGGEATPGDKKSGLWKDENGKIWGKYDDESAPYNAYKEATTQLREHGRTIKSLNAQIETLKEKAQPIDLNALQAEYADNNGTFTDDTMSRLKEIGFDRESVKAIAGVMKQNAEGWVERLNQQTNGRWQDITGWVSKLQPTLEDGSPNPTYQQVAPLVETFNDRNKSEFERLGAASAIGAVFGENPPKPAYKDGSPVPVKSTGGFENKQAYMKFCADAQKSTGQERKQKMAEIERMALATPWLRDDYIKRSRGNASSGQL